jgi:uncharacterized protein YndB with AHSA1/START domain
MSDSTTATSYSPNRRGRHPGPALAPSALRGGERTRFAVVLQRGPEAPPGRRTRGRAGAHANSLAADGRPGPVNSEGLDPILIQVTIPLPIPMIYAAFTDPAQLKGWLADDAEVKLEVGGTYRLVFKGSPEFESRGTIHRFSRDVDIGFSWLAPPPFAALMNQPNARTQVYVRLQESPEGIDVTLEHEGWGASEAWEEARSWHFHFWDERLSRLKDYLIKAAYG